MSGNRMHAVRPARTLTAASPRTTADGHAGSLGGAGAAGERASNSRPQGAPAVPGGHPATDLESPWHTTCLDAVGRNARLLAYPTGTRALVLKFPPGESATLFPGNNSIGALIEAVEFASWWRP